MNSSSGQGIAAAAVAPDATPASPTQGVSSATVSGADAAKLAAQLPRPRGAGRAQSANFSVSTPPSNPRMALHQALTKSLQVWVAKAPPDEIMNREEATKIIDTAFTHDSTELSLSSCALSSLPDCLQHLHCLKELDVGGNFLTSLPALPNSLERLDASHNRLSTLPRLPAALAVLEIMGNALTTLPVLPATLREIHVSWNVLERLPALPEALSMLDASYTHLKVLPELPKGLQTLKVNDSRLKELPALPKGLRTLHAGHDSVQTLPQLPASLSTVWIGQALMEAEVDRRENQITSLMQSIQNPQSIPVPAQQPVGLVPTVATDFDNLPSELVHKIVAAFPPASPHAARLGVINRFFNNVTRERARLDGELAEAQNQLVMLNKPTHT